MNTELLKAVGQIAGIGGLALGVFLILFKEIIRKNIFPKLNKEHAYRLISLISILVWSVAIVGVLGWIVLKYQEKTLVDAEVPVKKITSTNQKTFGDNSHIITDSKGDVNITYSEE